MAAPRVRAPREEAKPALAVRFLETAMRGQVRALALTVGTTVRVEKSDGQESLRKWQDFPVEVREAFVQFLDKAGAAGIDVASLLGATPVNALPPADG